MYAPVYVAGQRQVTGQEKHCFSPFYLVFVKGNISRCAGCGKRDLRDPDGKVHLPPDDLCLQRKEFVTFENPHTGLHQKSQLRSEECALPCT